MPPESRVRIALKAYLRQRGICPYCRRPVTPDNATWEHVIPRGWGGMHAGFNIFIACQDCNSAKSSIESMVSNLANGLGKRLEVDWEIKAALFMLRCAKAHRKPPRRLPLPQGTFLRMALYVQQATDFRIRERRGLGIPSPEISALLIDRIKGTFI